MKADKEDPPDIFWSRKLLLEHVTNEIKKTII